MTGLTRGTVVLAEGTAQAKVGKWGVGLEPGVLAPSVWSMGHAQDRVVRPRSVWEL